MLKESGGVMSACLIDYTVDIGGWAPWVQAIGTILALVVAIWVPARQHALDVERERKNKQEAQKSMLEMLLTLTDTSISSIGAFKKKARAIANKGRGCVAPEDVLQVERGIISRLKIYQLSDHNIIEAAVHFGRLIDIFRLNITILADGRQVRDVGVAGTHRLKPGEVEIEGFQTLCDQHMKEIGEIADVVIKAIEDLKKP